MWNYIVDHWRGRFGLLRSSLLNGVAIYLVLTLGGAGVGMLLKSVVGASRFDMLAGSPVAVFGVLAVFILWLLWAVVGVFRCGVRNAFDTANTKARRIGGVAAIAGVVLVVSLTAKDVYHLFLFSRLHF
jgi:hypothetical protein